jgi:hypothetical protein
MTPLVVGSVSYQAGVLRDPSPVKKREQLLDRLWLGPIYRISFQVPIFLSSMNCTSYLFDTSTNYFGALDRQKWMVVIYLEVPENILEKSATYNSNVRVDV